MTGSSLPSRAAAVKSVPNFSRALYWPSGSGVVTRRPPLDFSNASSSFLAPAPCCVQHLARLAALGRDADEQVLGGEVLVPQLLGPPGRVGDDREQLAVGLRGRDGGPGHAGQPGQQPLRARPYRGLVRLDRRQQVGDVLVVLAFEQREQQVRGGQIGMSGRHRPAGGGVDRVPALVGQLGVHVRSLLLVTRRAHICHTQHT